MEELTAALPALERARVTLLAVSIGTPDKAKKLVDDLGYLNDQILFVDIPPDLKAYRAVGLLPSFFTRPRRVPPDLGGPLQLLNPFRFQENIRVIREQFDAFLPRKEIADKWRPRPYAPTQVKAVSQQGGAFVYDSKGELIFASRDRIPPEYVPVPELLDIVGVKTAAA
ncbi:unnamed protein product [Vitrella brassicaformis CCMP3155]|uniref:Alkyl hydroperoxide reductase subunit C/ Thiol specific antioxidant domain-containing protein n=1 Tax=Vitrella brassicaformis (strain CCMP3155) TaxID=1169540 RepID=A0A0G4F7W0_VITBC|nr:unnamed protein product [Vitrella brassicaformis CCMP3155]|mmetsp:Transcript_34001/g.84043  ORF Transcript_34001/g.84043 Transcript_34001/m.84043 type:complete len:169 (-) Transcript_34001:353-859(-)|eukprot:CEM08632.1 unnamed protein product [Vitrella brassicaformis CCMP3155]